MKTLYIFIACGAILSLLVGCRDKMDYETTAFVNLDKAALVVDENVGTVSIPVKLGSLKGDGNTAVTFKVVGGKAVEGKNFTVEPAGKVLNFDGSGEAQNIKINIVDQKGVFTGALDFAIVLESATNDYLIGGTNTLRVTIKDLDHPLTDFFGDWQVQCNTAVKGKAKYTMTLSPDDDDVTVVWCNKIVPMLHALSTYGVGYVKGVVSEDKSTITFASQPLDARGGKLFDLGAGTGGSFSLATGTYVYVDGGDADKYHTDRKAPVVFKKADGDGLVYKSGSGPCLVNKYVWPDYYGFVLGEDNNEEVVWTKL